MTDTEVVDNASELIELYNPAEVFAAFAEAAREAAGLAAEPTATDDLLGAAGVAPEETFGLGVDDGVRGRRRLVGRRRSRRCSTRTTRRARRSRCTTSRSTSRSGARPARPACSTSSRSRRRG